MLKSYCCLAVSLTCLSVNCLALETPNGRLSGVSYASYVTGGFADGVLLNPSLGASHAEDDNFAFTFNVGGRYSDPADMLDAAEELSDILDRYRFDPRLLNVNDAHTMERLLNQMNDERASLGAGGSVLLAFPNDYLAVSVFVRSQLSTGFLPHIDDRDLAFIDDAINGIFSSDELYSTISARGSLTTEAGIALAHKFNLNERGQLLIGATPKHVKLSTFIYEKSVADYIEDDIDADEYRLDDNHNNLDVGITYIDGALRYGMTISNLISHNVSTAHAHTLFSIEPQVTAAFGYHTQRIAAEIALDLNAVDNFALLDKTQQLRAGVEYSALSWLQLRAGLQRDLQSTREDTWSLGFGLSPFNTFNLDISALKGGNETLGASLQLGLRF